MGGIVGVARETTSHKPCIVLPISTKANDFPSLCGARNKTPV